MNSRHFITQRYGGIDNALADRSPTAAVIHGIDVRTGTKGAFADHGRKRNPFRGIAHTNGSSYNQRYFRHIEGARDSRPAWPQRNRRDILRSVFSGVVNVRPFRDINPVPVSFCE